MTINEAMYIFVDWYLNSKSAFYIVVAIGFFAVVGFSVRHFREV